MSEKSILSFNLFSADFKKSAYTMYQQLRGEDPVHFMTMPSKKRAWLVTRYQDAVTILKDPRFIKNPARYLTTPERDALLHRDLSTHMLKPH